MTAQVPRVVEASLQYVLCAYPRYCEQPYALGEFVVAREGTYPMIGVVVTSESGPEDPTRGLQARGAAGQTAAEVMRDNPEIRLLLRTQLGVVTCGYFNNGVSTAGLPPVPPPLLAAVERATREDVADFVGAGEFLERLVAESVAGDSAIAAAVRSGAEALGNEGDAFKVRAGKELARLLRADPARLGTILRGVAA